MEIGSSAVFEVALLSRAREMSSHGTWDCAACGAKGCWAKHKRCWKCWEWRPGEGGSNTRRDRNGTKPHDQQQPASDTDAREEANKKLATLRSRVRDLRAQAAEDGMSFLGEAADKVQEEVRRLGAQKEQTLPRCFTQAQVERDRRKAEKARDRIKKKIESLTEKAADIQKELAEEQKKLESKEKHIQELETKKTQLEQAAPPDAHGKWTKAAHHLEQAAAMLQTMDAADMEVKAKQDAVTDALALVKRREQAQAEAAESQARQRSASRKRGAEAATAAEGGDGGKTCMVAIPAKADAEQVKQLLLPHCKPEEAAQHAAAMASVVADLQPGFTLELRVPSL